MDAVGLLVAKLNQPHILVKVEQCIASHFVTSNLLLVRSPKIALGNNTSFEIHDQGVSADSCLTLSTFNPSCASCVPCSAAKASTLSTSPKI